MSNLDAAETQLLNAASAGCVLGKVMTVLAIGVTVTGLKNHTAVFDRQGRAVLDSVRAANNWSEPIPR